jgi:pre-mRNA-processing factor 39
MILKKRVFEKALTYIGLDYSSGRIWDMYLNFEAGQKDLEKANVLFWRLITVPLKDMSNFVVR